MPYYIKRKKQTDSGSNGTSKLVKKLDRVFSLYIRLRDSQPFGFKAFRCIACGQVKPFEQADCGHYMSRRHMSLRYSETNCNAECRACNRFSADHLVNYRSNLIKKVGEQQVVLLESFANEAKKWHAFELEQMIKVYEEKVKAFKKLT